MTTSRLRRGQDRGERRQPRHEWRVIMYVARGDKVYYRRASDGRELLFLTVHPNNGSDFAVEEQAEIIAEKLNTIPRSAARESRGGLS